ncbi:MAG: dihydroorotase [Proteobacteria bacterium]|nr:MAG: dihydroorotase [Pseudomonadota bacterium]
MYHAYEHYVIKNVELWTEREVISQCDVEIQHGRIKAIEKHISVPKSAHLIDGRGFTLLPAGVDPQVHLRVPGQAEKETAGTGLLAALRGGIAAVLSMPNTKPTIDSTEVCEAAVLELEEAEHLTGVKAYLTGSITQSLKGKAAAPYKELADWGVKAFTDDGLGVVDDDLMRSAFEASELTGLPILQHAEFPGHGGVLAAGPVQEKLGIPAYPAAAEADMVARDIHILKDYPKARYHVLHVSAHETLELVSAAKAEGLHVSCEVTPHHLWFSSDEIKDEVTSFKMNPPLRGPSDKRALRKALADGTIDFVATDHAPHEASAKGQNFKTSAFGTTGLETSLRVLLSLVTEGVLSPQRLVQVFSSRPARFLGIEKDIGDISIDRPMAAVLVNRESREEVTEDDLFSLSKNSCFLGEKLDGKIESVFLADRYYQF